MPLLDLLYPRVCAACDAHGRAPLCAACDAGAPWIGDACLRCALPLCRGCAGRGLAFDRAASAAIYAGAARDALMRFKAAGEHRVAAALAARMTGAARRAGIGAAGDTVCTWVPSGRAALRARGRNPAELLARPLARSLAVAARPLLVKTRETPDLAGLARAARRRALEGVFAIAAPVPPRVLLVDDVLTTGTTASACAGALKAGGASRVDVVTFARAL
ncbi:MAG TPA: double zinc ribbon domain-containing protein [Actinomycetota bacterium]|nr:double zinc ribbon domain-containing protein [Actinomycetota bacterium]